jgi:leucyl aminopeptidase (aminopeptidase T)
MIEQMLRVFTLVASVLSMLPGSTLAQTEIHYGLVAQKLVERMALRPGEKVLLVAIGGMSDQLIPVLREQIRAAGATDLGVIPARGEGIASWATEFTRSTRGKRRAALAKLFSIVDVAIMMPGAQADDVPYAAMQDVLRGGRARTVHFHWAGAYALDGRLMDVSPRESIVYQTALLETDYAALGAAQRRFEAALRSGEVRVTTPEGTDLRFRIGDRPVTKQDGDASATRAATARNLVDREVELPAGAVRVAPLEETVEGRIVFPRSYWGRSVSSRVDGLALTFARGRVTSVRAQRGSGTVERELSQGKGAARSFREFALGMNPLLVTPEGRPSWIPYYGYGAGVVRLSLGDNTELGGAVTGGYYRWNFFTDATVTVSGDVWVRDGKLVRN